MIGQNLIYHTDISDKKFGVPEQKKFPMPDADHVRSAIKFFNYVEPKYEKELAKAIIKRMKEYGLTFDDFTVGDENRFKKYIPKDELTHHGIKGQRWGVRRWQNEDGTLTERGKKHYQKLDDKWVDKKSSKIEAKAYRQSQREMKKVTRKLNRKYRLSPNSAKAGRKYMNEYNQNLARIMNTKVKNITSPSGRSVKFIAKRGDYGVVMALADKNYDMSKVQKGVWDDGRVAYKSEKLEKHR